MARYLAGGLWGLLQTQLEKNLRKKLQEQGLPQQTLSLTQGMEGKTKVALLTLHLPLLNRWLLQPQPHRPLGLELVEIQFQEEGLSLVADFFARA